MFHCQTVSRAIVYSKIQHMARAKAEAHDRMQNVKSQSSSSPNYSKQPSQWPQNQINLVIFVINKRKGGKQRQSTNHLSLYKQELICCAVPMLKFRNQTPNEHIRFTVEKKFVSHIYKERIHSSNALQNNRVQNKDAEVLIVFCFMGQKACS